MFWLGKYLGRSGTDLESKEIITCRFGLLNRYLKPFVDFSNQNDSKFGSADVENLSFQILMYGHLR